MPDTPVATIRSRLGVASRDVLEALLTHIADAPGGSGMLKLGGWLCLIDGFLALYVAMALVINETAGKPVLPIR